MSQNQVLIILNGEDKRVLTKNSNKIIITDKKSYKIDQDHTLLQSNFGSVDEFIKAKVIIKNLFSKIDEIVLINRDIDLNMISYQYDFENIKQNYQTLLNIIYFINLLIPLFNEKFCFVLSLEKDNHYKIHLNNFKISLINYLNALKKDLIKSKNIKIKILD